MQATNILILLLGFGAVAYYLGRGRSLAIAGPIGGIRKLHSLPVYYGMHCRVMVRIAVACHTWSVDDV